MTTPETTPGRRPGLGTAIKDVREHATTLVGLEVELAKLELQKKLATLGAGAALFLAAAVLVGFLWLSLTLMFEFGVGYYLFHRPWEHLIADYNLARGRVLILVLIVTLKAPFLAATARVLLRP